jgi:hypothetical protein
VHEDKDPVAGALQALKSQQWAGGTHNDDLEERLMREFDVKGGASRFSRHRLLAVAAAVLLIGGAGFAVAGGLDMVRSWFVTVEIGPGAIEIEEGVLEEGEMVTATIDVDCDNTTITLTDSEGNEIPKDKYTVDEEGVTVIVEPAPDEPGD